jgi:hypothetical protein
VAPSGSGSSRSCADRGRVSGAPYRWGVEATRTGPDTDPAGRTDALLGGIAEVLERIEGDLHLLIEVARHQQRLLDLIAKKLS